MASASIVSLASSSSHSCWVSLVRYRIHNIRIVKSITWLVVSKMYWGEDEKQIARTLEITINAGFFLILEIFCFKM